MGKCFEFKVNLGSTIVAQGFINAIDLKMASKLLKIRYPKHHGFRIEETKPPWYLEKDLGIVRAKIYTEKG